MSVRIRRHDKARLCRTFVVMMAMRTESRAAMNRL